MCCGLEIDVVQAADIELGRQNAIHLMQMERLLDAGQPLLTCYWFVFPSSSSLGKTMSCFRTLRIYVIDLQHLLTVVLYTLQMWGKNREGEFIGVIFPRFFIV